MKIINKKSSNEVCGRAWSVLRIALLWAKNGGALKRLRRRRRSSASICYGERELSFDDTPIFHVKMHRPSSLRFKVPHIPCINPHVEDFSYDFDGDHQNSDSYYYSYDICHDDDGSRKSFLKCNSDRDGGNSSDHVRDQEEVTTTDQNCNGGGGGGGGGEIDAKAEEFITRFHNQMKLQRQISYLQYNEMLHRSTS